MTRKEKKLIKSKYWTWNTITLFSRFWAFRIFFRFSRLENETRIFFFFFLFFDDIALNVVMKILNKNDFFSSSSSKKKSLFLICDVFYWYRWHWKSNLTTTKRERNEMRRDSLVVVVFSISFQELFFSLLKY